MLLLTDLFPLFSIVILWQYYNFVTIDRYFKGIELYIFLHYQNMLMAVECVIEHKKQEIFNIFYN